MAVIALFLSCPAAFGQPEVMAWGNLTGIRVDGHLLEFGTSMCVAQPDLAGVSCTGRERQTNNYSRSGKVETVTIQMRTPREFRDPLGNNLWVMAAKEVVEETGPGTAKINLEFTSPDDAAIGGAFLGIELPSEVFAGGAVELIDPVAPARVRTSLAPGMEEQNEYLRATAAGARFISRTRQIEVLFGEPTQIIVRDDRRKNNYDLQVLLTVISGKAAAGQTAAKSFSFKVTGEPDRNPVQITLDASRPGQVFDGFGGNFRLQSPRDSQVIDYTLENMRVAWGRVEMPWNFWQPDETADPLAAARAGNLNPRIQQAMEMARKLAQKGMPVMVSAWSAPAWAILGATGRGFGGPPPTAAPAVAQPGAPPISPAPTAARGGAAAAFQPDGPRGNPLNPAKMDRIRESIASYLVFLKEKYGVEAALFSFNESDLGINVRQTPREHDDLIRNLGATFAAKGLATKLALGDTSDANPIDFIKPALHDPAAAKYIGVVDFHSWRGCTDGILKQWYEAAREMNVPLIVAEGSTDAAAHQYPQIFSEQSFALYEINLYLRILAIAQPKSILQWQLTADYSVLAGGGIFGDGGPLRPTRRFWNLKQLASTPPRSFALPVNCGKPNVTCAAFGNIAEGVYTVHLVNNGATRTTTLTGLPASVKQLRLWVTDSQRGMQEGARVPVTDGKAEFQLDSTSFTTLVSVTNQ
jgi:O-glycosyl hydrolase